MVVVVAGRGRTRADESGWSPGLTRASIRQRTLARTHDVSTHGCFPAGPAGGLSGHRNPSTRAARACCISARGIPRAIPPAPPEPGTTNLLPRQPTMSAPLRATAPLRGAHRLPMTSKQGNKNYYKGSGAANVFARQRITRTTRRGRVLLGRRGMPDEWTWMKTQVDESRTTAFVVPPGLGECKVCPLQETRKKEGPAPRDGTG